MTYDIEKCHIVAALQEIIYKVEIKALIHSRNNRPKWKSVTSSIYRLIYACTSENFNISEDIAIKKITESRSA